MVKRIIKGCESRGDKDDPYLTRLTLISNKHFRIFLHKFHRSDHADDFHNHPWNFVSIILLRGYIEETPNGRKRINPFRIIFRRADWIHRVELESNKPTYTLVIAGPFINQWGFFNKKSLEWTYYKEYFTQNGCWQDE